MVVSANYLFEVSWEVCNKVGGIYTVISSKAAQIQQLYENYILIGPYFEQKAKLEFTHEPIPREFVEVFEELQKKHIICHYGRWDDVKSKPKVILIEFAGLIGEKNNIKEKFWKDYQIDSLRGYWDFEEPSLWSYAVGMLIHQLSITTLSTKKIVAQFHEWLSAFGLLYLKNNSKTVGTIFTTHATALGRTLSANGIDLYGSLKYINPIEQAYRFNIEAKHLTERAAAMNADVFTTVSEITGIESEHFLSRKPEVLLYNGLDIDKFPGIEDMSIKHRISREKIREFLSYYYFPYYSLDMDKNLLFYTIGRYEYHNKGYDIIVKALGKLNDKLKQLSSLSNVSEDAMILKDHTVTMFFWIPMEQHGLKMEILENKNYYMHIKNYVNANGDEILTKIIHDAISRKEHPEQLTLTDNFMQDLRKDVSAFERTGNAPLSTHNVDEQNNQLITALKQNGLLNRKEDIIKVICEPVYLDGNDGFIELTYYDAIIGCHLGLFPSYYEPWGYTPLESVALGVPAITTDYSGFGLFAKKQGSHKGVYILERANKSESDIVEEFAMKMFEFLKLNLQERIEYKLNAKRFSELADWKIFVNNYVNAHNMAISIALKRS